MPPPEVFVLRIMLPGSAQEQAVHGVGEFVRSDRRCAFHSLADLVRVLRQKLEVARIERQSRTGS